MSVREILDKLPLLNSPDRVHFMVTAISRLTWHGELPSKRLDKYGITGMIPYRVLQAYWRDHKILREMMKDFEADGGGLNLKNGLPSNHRTAGIVAVCSSTRYFKEWEPVLRVAVAYAEEYEPVPKITKI